MPVGRSSGVHSVGVKGCLPCPPPPLPTGILYSSFTCIKNSTIDIYDLMEKIGDFEQSR